MTISKFNTSKCGRNIEKGNVNGRIIKCLTLSMAHMHCGGRPRDRLGPSINKWLIKRSKDRNKDSWDFVNQDLRKSRCKGVVFSDL